MNTAHKVVLEIYKAVLPQLVTINMPSHVRKQAVQQAMQIALDAAEHFATLTEEDNAEV